MFYSERHDKIIEILKERNGASVHYLAKSLYVSEPTIRRDLAILENDGKIKRTFGGALLSELTNSEIPLALRERENTHAKSRIARKAAGIVKEGSVIFLDASSTVSGMVEYLSGISEITVITNSPKTSLHLAELKIRSFCTGGLLLANSIAYVGEYAQRFVRGFNADYFFFSSRGISDDGMITDSSIEESELRRTMLEHSAQKIFLCDNDKIGNRYMYNLCSVSDVDLMISDRDLPCDFFGMVEFVLAD